MNEARFQRRPIRTLPSYVADRIKAGEVVERPAAVVKELMENSLDADAHKVTVIIDDAGRTRIQVIDDGYGMTPADMLLAIQRYATSKLTRYEDLDSLATFGFRGEALPSIAAVSRLEILSCPREMAVGNRLKVDGGTIGSPEPAQTPAGTSISVNALFYNVPARRKFLRSDAVEFGHIATIFRNFAMSFPNVTFDLIKNGDSLYHLPAAEDPRVRLAGLLGDDIAEEMIPVEYNGEWMRVTGWITPPSLAQKSKNDQYLFLNNRPIASYQLTKAINNACSPYIVTGGNPLFVLYLQSSPDRFDINVHPTKKEVKFDDEKGAFNTVWNAVRKAVSGSIDRSLLDSPIGAPVRSVEPVPANPVNPEPPISRPVPGVTAPAHLRPFTAVPRQHNAGRSELLFPVTVSTPPDADSGFPVFDPEPIGELNDNKVAAPVVWQLFNTYIVSPLKNGVVFFDQHVAHERILFEKALDAMEKSPWDSQHILFPVEINLSEADMALVEELLPLLRAMGFELVRSGRSSYSITAVPMTIRISDESEIVLGIIEEYKENSTARKDPRHRLAASFACKGAVKAGQPLENEEMLSLIDNLFRTRDPEFCPHGRPIYHILQQRDVEKWFRR